MTAYRTVCRYYDSMKHFFGVYDRQARQCPAPSDSAEDFLAWQGPAREKFREILGLNLLERCDLNPRMLETLDGPGFRVERVEITSAPGLKIPLNVMLPLDLKPGERRPVWLTAFGHGSPHRMFDQVMNPNDPFGGMMKIGVSGMRELVKRGYIAIAFDSFGSGERMDYEELTGEAMDIGSDNPLNNVLTSLGLCKVGMEVWDYTRVADYALSRPDCDGRLGVGGTSGGGHQALFFAACDARVCAATTSVWFYGFRDAHIGLPHNCSCNFVPNLWNSFDCEDIGALVAPRPLHVETGFRDYLSSRKIGIGNVILPLEAVRDRYALVGRREDVSIFVYDGGHNCEPETWEYPGAPRSGDAFLKFAMNSLPLGGAHA